MANISKNMMARFITSNTQSSPKNWKHRLSRFSQTKLYSFLVKGIVVAGVVVLLMVTGLTVWISRDLPDPNTLSNRTIPQSTKIYDRTGKVLLYEIHGDEKRTLLKWEEIPDSIKQATVAIEDKNFYEHHGIYWKGLVRALLVDLVRMRADQGASTLTQQLIKNAILANESRPIRKIKEFLLAFQIERIYTKDQILQMYLNEIPYGSNLYGIESAAQAYFGKRAKDLTLDESALLASIPQATDIYSPYGSGLRGDNRDRLVRRQHTVLDQMATQKYITQQQAEEAKAIDTLKKLKPRNLGNIKAPHFIAYVRSVLIEKYGQKAVEQGGMTVITTLDWNAQQIAEDEIKKGVEARGKIYQFTNAALIAIHPKTGQIISMVGSKDFFDTEHDGQVNVTLRPRQPGSSFKPIVYALAFSKGYLPQTQLWDVKTIFKTDSKDYIPADYDQKERGPVSLRTALQGSLNIPAVKLLYLVGVGPTLQFAEQLGYTTFGDRSRFGLALVLGGGEVKPIEHASAFAAFAADGKQYPTSAVLKVVDTKGTVLEEWKQPDGKQVVDTQVARTISDVLSDNDARTYVFGARNALTLPDRPVAAKTGTTNDFHDAWTVGYTPNLATVVWVGNNNNKEMKKGSDGSVLAAPIWQGFMRRFHTGLPVESFTKPDTTNVTKPALLGTAMETRLQIDKISGKRATPLTPPESIEERVYYTPHDLLQYVDKNDPAGPEPQNPANDPQYIYWEQGVMSWVSSTRWHIGEQPPTEYDDVHTAITQPHVTIAYPSHNTVVRSRRLNLQLILQSLFPITRVEAQLDGVIIGSHEGPSGELAVVIPDTLPSGPHDLQVTAIDTSNNQGLASAHIVLEEGDTQPINTAPTSSSNNTINNSLLDPLYTPF